MNKKLGPLPVWAWVLVAAVGGYIIYRMRQAQAEPEVEGYYPAERREPNEGEASGGAAGTAGLEEARQAREEHFTEGQEERAYAREEGREAREERAEEREEGFQKWAAQFGRAAGRVKPGGKGKRGKRGKQGARGKRGRQGAKRAPSSRNPRHTHQPAHTPSRHPKARIGIAQGRPVGARAVPASRPRARAKAPRRRRR